MEGSLLPYACDGKYVNGVSGAERMSGGKLGLILFFFLCLIQNSKPNKETSVHLDFFCFH